MALCDIFAFLYLVKLNFEVKPKMNTKIPRVSVIIPFYNQLDWVSEAIDSVLTQTFSNFEILLIDDGSSENIKNSRIDLSDKRIKYVRKEHSGPGASRNFGIEAARGEFIAFLDSDDLFEQDKLEKQVEFMEENNINFCHTSYITFDRFGNEKVKNTSWFVGDVFKTSFVTLPLATPTIIVRRDALENPRKRFAEHMRFGEDGFLWLKLAKEFELFCHPEALSRVRIRGDNTSIKVRHQLQAKSQLYDFMNENSRDFFNEIPVGVRILYILCKILYTSIEKATIYFKINPDISEFVYKVLYMPLWLFFKIYRKILLR